AAAAGVGPDGRAAPVPGRRRLVRRRLGVRDRVRALVGRRGRMAAALGLGAPRVRPKAAAMSWVAHDLEPYVFQRKLRKGAGISFVALVLGSWGPDMFTKWFVYGTNVFGLQLKASDPVQFQRGWPGMGFTHSLAFGAVVAGLVYLLTRSKPWAVGLLLGIWMHTISDCGDTVGTMLFFPWTHHFALGAWRYTADLGRL